MDRASAVCNAVEEKISPPPTLKRSVQNKAEEVRRAVERECIRATLEAEVRLEGSVAKDTWIRAFEEADVFMLVSPKLTKQQLRDECLPVARTALKRMTTDKIVERFAEHPFVESNVPLPKGRLRVNVVPCYRVERGNWLSATDRTPFHTEYVNQHLTEEQRGQVRLLKAFMKGIGSYGADIRTGGFSGMLCETLILANGTFLKVASDFAGWQNHRYIDIEHYYTGREREVHRIFREPLVVIDPVDKGRNVAAAVRPTQLWNFVAASRHFLEKPRAQTFFEPKVKPLKANDYRRMLRQRGSALICMATRRIDAVVDILWSQLYRTERALTNLLANNDFQVIRTAAWSDEHTLNVLLFELESGFVSYSKKHEGPPVVRKTESASFLAKHSKARSVAGPWIEDERWVVQHGRNVLSAARLLGAVMKRGGSDVGVASLLSRAFRRNGRIVEDQNIGRLISRNKEFACFMRSYLSGRPTWLV